MRMGRLRPLAFLTVPGSIPRGGGDMARIWTDLRAPSRDNPSSRSFVESILLLILVLGAAIHILIATILVGWYLLGGGW